MNLSEVLLQRYPGIRGNIKGSVYDKLSGDDMRKLPADMNSIIWNIWHIARVEDVGINRMVVNDKQVFDEGNWMGKLNIDIRHFGTGMSQEEVSKLSKEINIQALKDYHNAVEAKTKIVFDQLPTINLDEKLEKHYLNKVLINEGVLHKNALWVEDVYQPKHKAWFLMHMALTHSFEHLGQIMLIRRLLGFKGTR